MTCALRQATFDTYENIVNLCINERVDALLIAGDIYDGADRSLRAQLKFFDGLKKLDNAGIRSFICHGNHDPLDGWEVRLNSPPGCVRFENEVTGEPLFPEEPDRATVYGISYQHKDVDENLSPLFSNLPRSRFNIGLLHCNVGGDPNHDSYAPCSLFDLQDTSIDYWALGHVHTREVLQEEGPSVVYPGNPQGRHPNELGSRGVYLVNIDEQGRVNLEFHPTDVIRWERRRLDITELDSEQKVLNSILDMAGSVLKEAEGRSVILRIILDGRGDINSWLRRSDTLDEIMEHLNEECIDASPWLWCERIQLETAPAISHEQIIKREDFVGDLARLTEETIKNPSKLEELRNSLRDLYETPRARRHLQKLLPIDEELKQLISAAEVECIAELVDAEKEE